MLRVLLGSTSTLKVRAVVEAVQQLLPIKVEVVPLRAASGVNEQPFGEEETARGSYSRARMALEQGEPGDWAVGIENGIIPTGTAPVAYIDRATVTLLIPDHDPIVVTSTGVPFPTEDVLEAKRRGFATTTVGSMIAERTGCNDADPHIMLTNGVVGREEILTDALDVAFALASKPG